MSNALFTCDCGRPIPDNDEQSLKLGECFKCRIQGVAFRFVGGGGYGKDNFHNGSLRDALRSNNVADSQRA